MPISRFQAHHRRRLHQLFPHFLLFQTSGLRTLSGSGAVNTLLKPCFRTSHCRAWKAGGSDKFFAVSCSRYGRRKYQVLVHSASQRGCHGEPHRDTAECSVCAAVSLSLCRSALKVAHGISFGCCSGLPCLAPCDHCQWWLHLARQRRQQTISCRGGPCGKLRVIACSGTAKSLWLLQVLASTRGAFSGAGRGRLYAT